MKQFSVVARAVVACAVCLSVFGCNEDDGTPALPAAGTGAAGTGAAGTGAAGTGAAGTGAAGTGAAGTGTAGTGTAGTGTAGMGTAGTGASMTGAPTWSAIYQEIITGTGCNGGPTCHASMVGGNLKMTTADEAYAALVGVKSTGTNLPPGGMNCVDTGLTRVVASDPTMSLLMKKLEPAPPCGNRMPPGGELTAAQLMQVRTWIMNGAMKN